MIKSIIYEYVTSKSTLGIWVKNWATSHALNITTSFFFFPFPTKTHLYPIGFILLGIRTIDLKPFRFFEKNNLDSMFFFFHLGRPYLYRHSNIERIILFATEYAKTSSMVNL